MERSILGCNVRVNSFARIEDSLVLDGGDVGRYAKVRRAIIDKGIEIPPEMVVGFDHEHDRARGFVVSPAGVTVIAKAEGVGQLLEMHSLEV